MFLLNVINFYHLNMVWYIKDYAMSTDYHEKLKSPSYILSKLMYKLMVELPVFLTVAFQPH
jgi:hypothetical protein